MVDDAEGSVYISLRLDPFAERAGEPVWSGRWQFVDRARDLNTPDFAHASDVVSWCRERGARRIFVILEGRQMLWAGTGPAPEGLGTFDPDDPRGRAEGAALALEAARKELREDQALRQRAFALEEGRRLSRRREVVGVSLDELAERVGVSGEWLARVESGEITSEVTMAEWIALVWATREGWPNERSAAGTRNIAWVAPHGQFLRQAEVIVNEALGLYD